MSTMRWITLLFALACVLPLHAEDFQKCRSEGGATAYRGKGCLAGETLLAVIEPIADPPPVQRSALEDPQPRRSRKAHATKRRQPSRAHAKKSRRGRTRPPPHDPSTRAPPARPDIPTP